MTSRNHGIAIVAILLLSPIVSTVAAQIPSYAPFAVESSEYRVELIGWERYGENYSATRFRFLVKSKHAGRDRFFVVENLTTAIERGEIGNDVLLLVGDVQGSATGLTLVDLSRAVVADFKLSYGGDLSPDGSTLVYRKFYPRTVPLEEDSDVIMALDLAATETPPVAIYPPPQRLEPEETLTPASSRHRVVIHAGFLWLDDPRRLVFVDMTEDAPWLVVVDLSQGLSHPRVASRRIPLEQFIKPSAGADAYQRVLDRVRSHFSAVRLRQASEERVFIELPGEPFREEQFVFSRLEIELPKLPIGEQTDGDSSR